MDYANERYVRIYTRDTDELLAMSWEARALLWECIRKADRSGLIETRRGARGLAAVCRMPAEVVERVLPELLHDVGAPLLATERGYVLRTFIEAQETPWSDAQRKRESRERRRNVELDNPSRNVTATGGSQDNASRNVTEASRSVTPGHSQSRLVTLNSDPIRADPIRAVPLDGQAVQEASAPPKPKKLKRAEIPIPDDWIPNDTHTSLASELGVDLQREARAFRDHALAHGRRLVDWNAGFRTWLGKAVEYGRARRGNGVPPNAPTQVRPPEFDKL